MDGDLSSLDSLEAWDYSLEVQCLADDSFKDLQLAAELGKTLLDRNKELENSLKQQQGVIEDQAQEIEYLTKQTAALREVNDSRLRIYEQLEVSIQDLERTNQKLAADKTSDKRHIKSLCSQIEALEAKCEELQRALEELSEQRRRQEQLIQQSTKPDEVNAHTPNPNSTNNITIPLSSKASHNEIKPQEASAEEIVQLLGQLQELKTLRLKEQVHTKELEEQLATLLQENTQLQEQLEVLQMKEKDLKSIQEEISTLEEVRQGQLCRKCLRITDTRGQDELSLVLDNEEDDVASVGNSVTSETYCSTVMLHIEDDNPYRELEARYEALLEMSQRQPRHHVQQSPPTNELSLQEELQMSGDFNTFNQAKDVDDHKPSHEIPQQDSDHVPQANGQATRRRAGKMSSATPTDFSEAETSSSGFSDETSNKATQTDVGGLPVGSYLCSIADGEDCRFSIYDDASPVESRFRKTPEYRQLFREIFAVLKRAAEEKGENEQPPRLDDATPIKDAPPKVPPVTPAKEEAPTEFDKTDATEAKVSTEQKSSENGKQVESRPCTSEKSEITTSSSKPADTTSNGLVLRPLPSKSEQIEYLSVGITVKKKGGKRKNSPMKRMNVAVETSPIGGSTLNYANRVSGSGRNRSHQTRTWYRSDSPRHHSMDSSSGSGGHYSSYEKSWEPQQQFPSPAYEGVVKLKQLDMSYAEALRNGPRKNSPGNVNGYRK